MTVFSEQWRRRATVVGCVLAVAVGVGGCSGGSSNAGSSSTTSTTTSSGVTASSTTSSAPASSPTSNATYAGAPGVPEAAKYKTDAGAIAFAKHYLETVNRLGQKPESGVLDRLVLPECKTCASQITTVESWVKDRQRLSGPQFRVKSAHRIVAEQGMVVNVVCDGPALDLLNDDGTKSESIPAETDFGSVFRLQWTASGWRTAKLQKDASGAA